MLSLSAAPSQNAPEKPPKSATGPPHGLSFRDETVGWKLCKADRPNSSWDKANPSLSNCDFLNLLCRNCFCNLPPAPLLLLHVTAAVPCGALPNSPSWKHAAHPPIPPTALADVLYAMALSFFSLAYLLLVTRTKTKISSSHSVSVTNRAVSGGSLRSLLLTPESVLTPSLRHLCLDLHPRDPAQSSRERRMKRCCYCTKRALVRNQPCRT